MTGHEAPKDQDPWVIRSLSWMGRQWKWLVPATLAVTAVLCWLFWDAFASMGNAASVLGLLVSVFGFVLTLWAVYETQRIDKEAKAQIRQAIVAAQGEIAAARTETREAVGKVAWESFRSECREAYQRLKDARIAIRQEQWERSAEKCEEGRAACRRLAADRYVEGTEGNDLADACERLTTTLQYIDRNKIHKADPAKSFPREYLEPVDQLMGLLEKIEARVRQRSMEPPNVERR